MTSVPTEYQLTLLAEHERVSTLLASVSRITALPVEPLRNQLALFESSEVVVTDSEVHSMYSELRKMLDSQIGQTLSPAEQRTIKELADEIRLRMVAVSLVSGLGIGEVSDLLVGDSKEFNPWQNNLVFGLGGITYASLRGYTVILFSPIISVGQCHDILTELSNIYDRTSLSNNWIFDFSTVTEVPVILLGSLLSYQRQLATVGKDLLICWAKPDIFPNESIEKLIRLFRLAEVGGYLFSRPLRSA